MPRAFIPIAPWTPDAGELRNPGMLELQGVAPWNGSYVPCQAQQEYFDEADSAGEILFHLPSVSVATLNGLHHQAFLSPTTGLLYFATSSNPATAASVDFFTLDTRSGPPWTKSSSLLSTAVLPPRFTAFGPHVIATGDLNGDMKVRLSESGSFTNLITTPAADPPRARFAAAMGNRFVLAFIDDPAGHGGSSFSTDGSMVWASATDDARVYTNGDTSTAARVRSNPFFLYDEFGHITGMAGGREFGVIWKERQTYRVEYGGLGLDFLGLSPGIGLKSPNGWCWAGEDLYFWSNHGPRRLRGDRVEEIGQISRTLQDSWRAAGWKVTIPTISTTENKVQCAYDQSMDLVVWALGESVIVYSPRHDELSLLSLAEAGVLIGSASGEPVVVQNIVSALDTSAVGAPLGGVIFIGGVSEGSSLDSPYFTRAGYNTIVQTRALGCEEVCVGSGYVTLSESGTSRITAVRPSVTLRSGGGIGTVSLTINTRNEPWGDDTSTTVANANQTMTNGWIPTPSAPDGCFHQVRLEFDNDAIYSSFDGFEVEYEEGSMVGGL